MKLAFFFFFIIVSGQDDFFLLYYSNEIYFSQDEIYFIFKFNSVQQI